jgi:hypothetical protein
MLDLRKPAGLFFILLGLLLAAAGVIAPDLRAPLLEMNLNLYFGIFSLVFGGVFLWLSRRA